MKLRLRCMQCAMEQQLDINLPWNWNETQADLQNDCIYNFTCKNGHKNSIRINSPKYELLFDMGLFAYKGGFYREACLDFAASLERFHEYCLYTIICQDNDHGIGSLTQLWNIIKKQSERQYGAFVTLYTYVLGEIPPKMGNKQVEFRNDVTHKGKFPTKEESLEYCKYIYNYIADVYNILSKKLAMERGQYQDIVHAMEVKGGQSVLNFPTFLSNICSGETFDEAFDSFEHMADLTYCK